MALHDTLRELIAARGVAVTRDAAEWRGALDDYLGESEASVGEVNLLVDAVRLGGVERLVSLLDEGADPVAAVEEAGAALARDRGTDDQRRSAWSVAAVGFAVGRVGPDVVDRYLSSSLGGPAPLPPGAAEAPPPPPTPDADLGTVESAEAVPTSFESDGDRGPGTPPSPRPGRRRTPLLLVLSFALVLGIAGGTGVAFWVERDTEGSDPSDPPTSGSEEPDAVPEPGILVNYSAGPTGAKTSRIYRVNVDKAAAGVDAWRQLTAGPNDIFPTISEDRTTMAYLSVEDDLRELVVHEVGGEPRRPFTEGACAHTGRPGWRPGGSSEFGVACTGVDDVAEGMYLVDVDGGSAISLFTEAGLAGSPTWTSRDEFVYAREDATGDRTFWSWREGDEERVQLEPVDVDGDAIDDPISHPDWSDRRDKLLFLVHPGPEGDEDPGQLWTADVDRESGTLANAEQLSEELYNHPVWSPDGESIAVTWEDDGGVEVLAVVPFDDPDNPDPVKGAPSGEVGIPVWGSR